jgi:hypothetical protein
VLRKGNTFSLPQNPAHENHLWVAISDPIPAEDNWILTVSISTVKDSIPGFKYDPACVLVIGEHRRLTKPRSYARYKDAQLRDPAKYPDAVRQGILIPDDDVTIEILNRLIAGAKTSEFFNLDWLPYLS